MRPEQLKALATACTNLGVGMILAGIVALALAAIQRARERRLGLR